MALYALGNTYSNLDLWWHNKAEWQAAPGTPFSWDLGASITPTALLVAALAMCLACSRLHGSVRPAEDRCTLSSVE